MGETIPIAWILQQVDSGKWLELLSRWRAYQNMLMRYSCTIRGDPRTKKNSMIIAGSGPKCPVCKKHKKQWPRQSPQHDAYTKAAARQLVGKPPQAISSPVHCRYLFYMATHRIVDGLNLEAAIDDLLVEADVLEDDNSRIVISHDGSRVLYDPYNPRVEITITDASDEVAGDVQLGLFDD